MKRYKIRENSIADKAIRLWNKIDSEPYATIVFFLFMMGMVVLFDVVINSVYPIV